MLDGVRGSIDRGKGLLRELRRRENRPQVIMAGTSLALATLIMFGANPAVDAVGRQTDKLRPDSPTPTPTLSPEQLRIRRLETIVQRNLPGLGSYEMRSLGGNWLELQQKAESPWKEDDLRREVFSKLILECNGMYHVAFVPRSLIPAPANPVSALIEVDMGNPNCIPELPR